MSRSHDDQVLQAEFDAMSKALAYEVKKTVAAAVEPDTTADDSPTEEERQLASVHAQQAPPEIERLIGHLHEIGVELRARRLLPASAAALD